MRLGEGRRWAARILEGAAVDAPLLDVDLLLEHLLACPRSFLLAHPDVALSREQEDRFRALIARRQRREPLAYLLGRASFWGRDFHVGPGCLIPRPDTEALLEAALGVFSGGRFVDWGTGSGCLAVSLALERPESVGWAVDASPLALRWAWENCRRWGVLDRVALVHAAVWGALPVPPASVDLVVSNPPYIPTGSLPSLMPEVGQFEPHMALDGGSDGMDLYGPLLTWAASVLVPGGYLVVEVGDGRQVEILRRETAFPMVWKALFRDLGGEVRGCLWQKTPDVAYNGARRTSPPGDRFVESRT